MVAKYPLFHNPPPPPDGPRGVKRQMEAGGRVGGYIGDGQVENRKCTAHTTRTERSFETRSR